MPTRSALVLLGCGFTGTAAVRLRHPTGRVVATTRSADRAAKLAQIGVEAHALPALTAELVARVVPEGAGVIVAFPPDGATDAAVAPSVSRARAVVYISSTGVYGDATGRVDEGTPVDRSSPRAAARLDAEAAWRDRGAVVLRAAGIYGPGRGLHLRLLRGEHRLTGDGGRNVVSRVHVDDLALLALAALDRAEPGSVFVVADSAPVPQIEVVTWLCRRLGLDVPPPAAPGAVPETLRHDRSVDSSAIQRALGVTLRYPTYREGFEACLAAEAAARG